MNLRVSADLKALSVIISPDVQVNQVAVKVLADELFRVADATPIKTEFVSISC